MTKLSLDNQYWNKKYQSAETGWDIGYPSPSFLEYFQNIERTSKLLIPGCGNSYEGEALHKMGFKNITLMDFAETSKNNFLKRYNDLPENQFIIGDFFQTSETFDYVLEQTFFCALDPRKRHDYLKKMKQLLGEQGKLVGLLFDTPLNTEHPPFGGSKDLYEELFNNYFNQVKMTPCKNSIPPRAGKELWIEISQ